VESPDEPAPAAGAEGPAGGLLGSRLRSGRNGWSGALHGLQLLQGFLIERGWRDCARRSLSEGGAGLRGLTGRWASGGRFRKVMSFCLLASGLTTWG